jgi:hypothetical protein
MQGFRKLTTAFALAAAAASGAHAATPAECQGKVGVPTATLPAQGAWLVVDKNGDSFVSNRRIPTCTVKQVLPSSKGKPATGSITIDGPMAQDECSMYSYLSSIDSKIAQGKYADAYTNATSMLSKVNELGGTNKLIDPGLSAVRAAVTDVQTCTQGLIQ